MLYRAAVVTQPKSFILPLEERMFQRKGLNDDFLGEFEISVGNYSLVTSTAGKDRTSQWLGSFEIGRLQWLFNSISSSEPLCECTNNKWDFQVPKASHQLAEELDILDGKVCSLVYSKIKYLTLSATAHLCIIGYGFF